MKWLAHNFHYRKEERWKYECEVIYCISWKTTSSGSKQQKNRFNLNERWNAARVLLLLVEGFITAGLNKPGVSFRCPCWMIEVSGWRSWTVRGVMVLDHIFPSLYFVQQPPFLNEMMKGIYSSPHLVILRKVMTVIQTDLNRTACFLLYSLFHLRRLKRWNWAGLMLSQVCVRVCVCVCVCVCVGGVHVKSVHVGCCLGNVEHLNVFSALEQSEDSREETQSWKLFC